MVQAPPPPPLARPAAIGRRGYLDWLRGLAVLIMIAAHMLDSWTRLEDRHSPVYVAAMTVAGIGAPLFLFLAGISLSLSAASKLRRSGNATAASRSVVARGLEIFGLAFLFRLQACILSWGPWWTLLKVDILNIMGPSIMAAGALWGSFRSQRGRCIGLGAAALALAFLTPPIRATAWLSPLPDPIEGYIRPRPSLTNFAIFPSSGFVFAGAVPGVLLAGTAAIATERTLIIRIGTAGAALTAAAYTASFFPSPYARSEFWTSSPSFFLIRTGILTALIGLGYAWARRPWGEGRFSPLQQLGRTSLFIYWIHVEMIYGLVVRPLHKSLSFPAVAISIPIFAVFMLLLSIAKERIAARFK